MGISIDAWRQRIGAFLQHGGSYNGVLSHAVYGARVTPRFACVIALLLIVAGVEVNPGPPKEDMNHRLEQLFNELRDTKTALLTKIDDSVREFTTQLQKCEDLVTQYSTRLSNVERTHETMATQIATLQASIATLTSAAASSVAAVASSADATITPTTTASLEFSDLIHELDLRVSKKTNIVLSGVLPTTSLTDTAIVTNLLRDELNINATVTRCTRLGKPSADPSRPCRLLATLSSGADALAVVRSAKKLRSSTNAHVRDHVYINADLTPEQRKQDYNLRTELKRRRTAGEPDLVIRNGKLITKPPRPTVAAAAAAVAGGTV